MASRKQTPAFSARLVQAAIVVSVALYGWIVWLSQEFAYDSNRSERPLVLTIGIFLLLSAIYLWVSWLLRRVDDWRLAFSWVLLPALLFRCLMLASEPIQEVDIYRYLWDGATHRAAVSPYRLAPIASWPDQWVRKSNEEQVRAARSWATTEELDTLRRLRDSSDSLREALRRVHFAHVPTVYPPVSQLGFRLVDLLSPSRCSLRTRLNVMRGWLILCDLSTLIVLMLILARTTLPLGLSALYGWCPLVIKEIANSGHLDSMAVLLTTLAVYAVVRLWHSEGGEDDQNPSTSRGWTSRGWTSRGWTGLAGALLGLGVGAKVYPLVLVPWYCAIVLRRRGWLNAVCALSIVVLVSYLAIRPMLIHEGQRIEGQQQRGGLSTFTQYWEMNDFLFLIVVENLKPTEIKPENQVAWFSFVPEATRGSITKCLYGLLPNAMRDNDQNAPFLVSRLITLTAYLVILCAVLVIAWRANSIEAWLSAGFLSVAWFFLWGPTQNPWYWVWAMPLLPFARSRTWSLLSGLLFLYYLRFWIDYHFSGQPVGGTIYEGEDYFHLVVTWFEFAPWFLLLIAEQCWRAFSCRLSAGCDRQLPAVE